MKTFTLRIDLESDKGIKAVPRLLDLLKKYNLKASFYVVMGGESNILEILRYSKKMESAGERILKIWSFLEKLRMILLPKDFVTSNKRILQSILEEGHELGIHGWKHREWTRGLDKIDISNRIRKSVKKYINLFGRNPESFASPGFNTNEKVLKILKKAKITHISDFLGKNVERYGGIKNIPMTILGNKQTPIIEYLTSNRKKDSEILEYIKKEIKKNNLVSFYIHGLFEIRFKLILLEEIFKFISKQKIENKRVIDY